MMMKTARFGATPDKINAIFTPEDILITETLYTLWETK